MGVGRLFTRVWQLIQGQFCVVFEAVIKFPALTSLEMMGNRSSGSAGYLMRADRLQWKYAHGGSRAEMPHHRMLANPSLTPKMIAQAVCDKL